jgi:glycyl-tRNA synthetase beta chain
MEATVLVELLTEELPPKSLAKLSQTFCESLVAELLKSGFVKNTSGARAFATPRRLAVSVPSVLAKAPDSTREVQGPSVTAASAAVAGFAKKNGIAADALEQRETPKGRVFVARIAAPGSSLDGALAMMVEGALKRLPIPKVMRWGDGEAQFVRPVHQLVMLHGSRVVAGTVLGLHAGNVTRGHRFMASGEIVLSTADEYEARLRAEGSVVASFAERRRLIDEALIDQAQTLGASLGEYSDLLDEVTALVEHPSVYVGEFAAQFLEVPQECLILTMRQNQKYFPLFAPTGKLLPKFLIVSNMRVDDPVHIIGGNQRVVRPRLEDARFFYTQDRKTRLEERVPLLGKVVYHNKLGTQLERTQRVQLVAGKIARRLGTEPATAERAAWLAKADLLTGMVGEFPELQGIMGRYYALADGEPAAVADAIESHYRPRFAGDRLPQGDLAASVALADKLDTLAGIFGIGGAPTGDKDPFALRRHALGVLRILLESQLALSLDDLIADAVTTYPTGRLSPETATEVQRFVLERLRHYLRELGHAGEEIEAVLSMPSGRIDRVTLRLDAVKAFRLLPEAKELAAANKRVLNIIHKNEAIRHKLVAPDRTLMTETAELALMDGVEQLAPLAEKHFNAGDYAEALKLLSRIKPSVDRFFDEVMVMVDDASIRNNRAALLQQLGALMNRVADISKLAA